MGRLVLLCMAVLAAGCPSRASTEVDQTCYPGPSDCVEPLVCACHEPEKEETGGCTCQRPCDEQGRCPEGCSCVKDRQFFSVSYCAGSC